MPEVLSNLRARWLFLTMAAVMGMAFACAPAQRVLAQPSDPPRIALPIDTEEFVAWPAHDAYSEQMQKVDLAEWDA